MCDEQAASGQNSQKNLGRPPLATNRRDLNKYSLNGLSILGTQYKTLPIKNKFQEPNTHFPIVLVPYTPTPQC